MTNLNSQDITNIVHAAIFAFVFLVVFTVFFVFSRRRNINSSAVLEVDAREPHSITITFVPVMPAEGIRAPAPTPAHGLNRTVVALDGDREVLTPNESIRIHPPAA
jgi:heme/copper-type cytochrome/quinol oxidase subunit 2